MLFRVGPEAYGRGGVFKGIRDLHRRDPGYSREFGARVFKISRDSQGNRLTHLKITGGSLKVKSFLDQEQTEKVNQIRIYSGEKFELASEAEAGCICVVTGPSDTRPGQGFGVERSGKSPLLEPVLTYQVILPDGADAHVMLKNLRLLEEDPLLHIVWDETLGEIRAQVMGQVQMEILKSQILERFGVEVDSGLEISYIRKPSSGQWREWGILSRCAIMRRSIC